MKYIGVPNLKEICFDQLEDGFQVWSQLTICDKWSYVSVYIC
jgi:hypothetical protein